MSDLVARTGRLQQRYEDGYRLVAGCIPYRYRDSEELDDMNDEEPTVEVLMINSTGGPGLLFPKGGWETDETAEEAAAREAIEEAGVRGDIMGFLGKYEFKSKSGQDEVVELVVVQEVEVEVGVVESGGGGLSCRASVYALLVKEELDCWPEQSCRHRTWLTIPEAIQNCRHAWMRKALMDGFPNWHHNNHNHNQNAQ